MKNNELNQPKDRKGEKGAAIVMVLLISLLLLVASAGILLETSLNSANVTDATAEQQAYNAAESGIQTAVNVLRGNTVPNPLINSNPSPTPSDNQINYNKALNLQTSNKPGEASSVPRLSRWLNYNYTSSGSAFPDRVLLGKNAASYNSQRDSAFSLTVSDPDNTGNIITYSTEGRFYDSNESTPNVVAFGSGSNPPTVTYQSTGSVTKDISSGSAITDFGKFIISPNNSTYVPAYSRFQITVNITKPYVATFIIRGYITTGILTSTPGTTAAKFLYDSQTYTRNGSVTKLSGGQSSDYTAVYGQDSKGKDITKRFVGYAVPFSALSFLGGQTINATITSPEPKRLLISSTGYGPRGAVKRLEAIIQKDYLDGLSAPATLTLIGPKSTTNPTTIFKFEPGSSNVTNYSGVDVSSSDIIPPIGTTDPDNLYDVEESVDGQPPHPFNGNLLGTPSDITADAPDWLKNPYNLDKTITSLYQVAVSSGRYFTDSPGKNDFGSVLTAQGITFVDGDCELDGSGGGILVVTGSLTLNGGFDFKGMIIVTGQGGVSRKGGGGGVLKGNMVIAPYRNSKMTDDKSAITNTVGFLAPNYTLSGGGGSTITYDSSSVANSLIAVSNFVLGVAEK